MELVHLESFNSEERKETENGQAMCGNIQMGFNFNVKKRKLPWPSRRESENKQIL